MTEALVAIEIAEEVCVGIGYCLEDEPDAIQPLAGYSAAIPGVRLPISRAQYLCDHCPSGAIRIVKSCHE